MTNFIATLLKNGFEEIKTTKPHQYRKGAIEITDHTHYADGGYYAVVIILMNPKPARHEVEISTIEELNEIIRFANITIPEPKNHLPRVEL